MTRAFKYGALHLALIAMMLGALLPVGYMPAAASNGFPYLLALPPGNTVPAAMFSRAFVEGCVVYPGSPPYI